MFAAGMHSCAIAVHFRPRGFAVPWLVALPFGLLKKHLFFRRFIRLLFFQECSGVIAPCLIHHFAVSSAVMPPRPTQNSLESLVPPVSLALVFTASATSIAVPTSVQALGTPPSASILSCFCLLSSFFSCVS